MTFQKTWDLICKKKLTKELVDKLSIKDVTIAKELLENYFAQLGHGANFSQPFTDNYLLLSKKIEKLKT